MAFSSTALHIILTDEETDAILQSASDCAQGECSIDDVSELVYELKEQEKVLKDRLEKISIMVRDLEHLNEHPERKTDDVRNFLRDMLRVFNNEAPKVNPTGYSGDVGKGSLTAWDALPPKKWKPSE